MEKAKNVLGRCRWLVGPAAFAGFQLSFDAACSWSFVVSCSLHDLRASLLNGSLGEGMLATGSITYLPNHSKILPLQLFSTSYSYGPKRNSGPTSTIVHSWSFTSELGSNYHAQNVILLERYLTLYESLTHSTDSNKQVLGSSLRKSN